MADDPNHLEISRLSLQFGGLQVLSDVCFELTSGEIVGLIGPNGAGKTALLNCIGGLYKPTPGSILRFRGKPLTGRAKQAARLGIARTFQHSYLIPEMSVIDNVMLGLTTRYAGGMIKRLVRPWFSSWEERKMRGQAYEALERCGVADLADSTSDTLPFGIRRRVDLARALVSRPRLLLLDEPASGLSQKERSLIPELIQIARASEKIGVLWIEHDLDLVISAATRVIVLHDGHIVADGDPRVSAAERELLINCYLKGTSHSGDPILTAAPKKQQ